MLRWWWHSDPVCASQCCTGRGAPCEREVPGQLMMKTGCLGAAGRIGMVVADFDDTCTQGDTIGILMEACINAATLVRALLCRWG